MIDLCTIDEPAAASALLDPLRNRLLSEMREPISAAGLAQRVGLPRQKVNYHLRTLEQLGLARVAEQRKWGGLTERLLEASAKSYAVSCKPLGPLAPDPNKIRDRLSANYLVAVGARLASEVSDLSQRADKVDKRLATLTVDTEIHFRSPSERAAFTEELTRAITQLVARYHAPDAAGSRPHRLVIGAHPRPTAPQEENSDAAEEG